MQGASLAARATKITIPHATFSPAEISRLQRTGNFLTEKVISAKLKLAVGKF